MYKKTLLSASIIIALSPSAMAESVATFDEVVVSATRTEQSKQDVSASIESVSSDELESSIANDLEDALKYTPGVDATTAGRFGISGFNIRGMDGDRVKVIVDGVTQTTPFNPGGGATQAIYPNAIELDTLKSIEINKGPSSSLYGSDALGGAVVMQTKDPEDILRTEGDEHRFGIKSSYRSVDEQFKNTLTWAMRQGKLETLLIGTYSEGKETQTYGDGADISGEDRGLENPAEKDLNNILAKAYYQLNETNRLGLVFERYNYNYDERSLDGDYTMYFGPMPGLTYDNSRAQDENTRTRIGFNHEYTAPNAAFDSLLWSVDYQVTESSNANFATLTDHMGYVGYNGDRTRLREAEDKSIQLDAQLDKLVEFDSSVHEFTYGFNYKGTDFSLNNTDIFHDNGTTSPGTTTIPDAKVTEWGIFLQDNAFFLNETLVLNAGIRYDSFEADPSTDDGFTTPKDKNSNDAFTGKLGAVYHFNQSLSTFAQVSQGFKAPTVEQLYYEYETGSIFVPNPDLEAEKSTSYEIGFRGQNNNAQFELVGFFNDYDDFIDSEDLGTVNGKESYTVVNRDAVEIKGAEFSSTILLDGAFDAPTGTYTKLSIAYAEGKDKTTGKSLDSVAPLTGIFGLGYDNVEYKFGALANLTMVAGKDDWADEDNVGLSGYGILDLTAYYRPVTDLTLRAGLFNAFDKKYWTYNDLRDKDSEDNLDFYSQPGRNWGVSLDYEF